MVKYLEIAEAIDTDEINATLRKCFNIDGKAMIHDDGFVSINGSCSLKSSVNTLPIKFKYVNGDFNCSKNILTSLKGCPSDVGGEFNCSFNSLRSLEGCPASVGGSFMCSNNLLTSLAGCSSNIGGGFWCTGNRLTSLAGCPTKVNGGFYCSSNELTSLEGGPTTVGGQFYCSDNDLTSLNGLPKSCRNIVFGLTPDLPLLRLVGHTIGSPARSHNPQAAEIINKYQVNASRSSIIACQNELIAAGFESNARW